MIDVNKLITGFLILVIVISGFALAFSGIGKGSPVAASNQLGQISASFSNTQTSPYGGSAFVDNTAIPSSSIAYQNATSDQSSLTNTLTDAFLNNIVSSNPSGPTTDSSGTASFVAPDQATIDAQVAETPAAQDVSIPDWSIEAASQKLNISTSSSPEDIAEYINSLGMAFNVMQDSGVQNVVNTNNATPDPQSIPEVQGQTDGILNAVLAIKTPASLKAFQQSLVEVLTYQKNVVALANDANNDPLKTSLIFQAEQTRYANVVQNFSTELQKAESAKAFSVNLPPGEKGNGVFALIDSALGIQTAHAQFGGIVSDPVTEAETTLTVAQMIWQWAQMIILQILKNTLINQLQNKVLSWVQGNGTPRFIQQWGRTFANAFISSANVTIQRITPNLSPSYGPLVGLALQSPGGGQFGVTIGSTLDQNLATLGTSPQAFYQNFNNGGFDAYLQTLEPDNNFYGALMSTSDASLNAGGNSNQAAQAQAISGQGFTGDEVCDDGSNPSTGTHLVCLDPDGVAVVPNPNGTCNTGQFPAQEPNGGICADGSEPQVTTPGQTTNQALSSAIGSPVHLIVNANNIVDLAVSMASSLLTNLANKAIAAGTNAINGGLNGTAGGSPPPTQPPATPVTCNTPLTTVTIANGSANAFFNVNGGQATNGILPSYTWVMSAGSTPTTFSGASVTVNYTLPGTYTATVTGSTGGSSTCTVTVQ